MSRRRLLLLAPDDYELYKKVEDNLKKMDYDVVTIVHNSVKFKYRNIWQRLKNVYHKFKDRNNNYKNKLRMNFTVESFIQKINDFESYDYCLVFRSDFFHLDVLKEAKKKSKKIVSYHYDGLKRNPDVYERIPVFDHFFVFDNEDLIEVEGRLTRLSHNFFFDSDEVEFPPISNDVYFLGFYSQSREYILLKFYDFAITVLDRVHFQIVFPIESRNSKGPYESRGINCLHSVIPFSDYLKKIEQSKFIVDFLIGDHRGLSFRIFEGLKYKRKVITTNSLVRNYDFYNEANFFVLNEDSLDEEALKVFLTTPYFEIDEDIRLKYSFINWIISVLEN